MKLTRKWWVKYMIVVCVFILSAGYASAQNLTLKVENTTLESVLKTVNKQTGYRFSYSDALKASEIIVKANVSNVNPLIFFNSFFKEYKIDYKVNGKLVSLSYSEEIKKEKSIISGKITDENNEPLAGVAVKNENDKSFTISDVNGSYSIEAVEGDKLSFSLIGMDTFTAVAGKSAVVNIPMKTDAIALGDVVVTGYQTLSRERATGSFAKVDSEVLASKISTDVVSRIDGLISGLKVDNEGNMIIRGVSTINANKAPLVVVDGFPIEGDISSVNPNDIASITVLKDAAAASIWGVRASNGVVVIVSNKGKSNGKLDVNFSYNLTFKNKPDLSSLRYASAAEHIDAELQAVQNGNICSPAIYSFWTYPCTIAENIAITSAGFNPFTSGVHPYEYLNSQERAQLDELASKDGLKEYEKYFIRNSFNNQYNLSISGNHENTNYYMSLIYDNNNSNFKGESYDRIILNTQISTKILNLITLSTGVSFTSSKEGLSGISRLSSSYRPTIPYGELLDENGNYNTFPASVAQYFKDQYSAKEGYKNWNYNPLQDFRNTDSNAKTLNYRIFADAMINVFKGLDFDVKYQYERYDYDKSTIYGKETHIVRNSYNVLTGYDNGGTLVHSFPDGAIKQMNEIKREASTVRAQLNYDNKFGKHSVNAIAGWEYRQLSNIGAGDTYFGYEEDLLTTLTADWTSINSKSVPTWNGNKTSGGIGAYPYRGPILTDIQERYVSSYVNIGYSYDNRYDVTLSGRIDDSNLFGASKKYRKLPLWSAGVSWNIGREKFMATDLFNLLKLRATYGFNGNIDRSTVPFMKANIFTDSMINKIVYEIDNPGNPDLRWEKTGVFNIGVDFSMLNDKISGSVEFYNKHSIDLIGQKKLNPAVGWTSITSNIASMVNRGFELDLNVVPIVSKNFRWDLNLILDYNKNNVKEIFSENTKLTDALYDRYLSKNKPIDAIYAYRWAGLDESGNAKILNADGEPVSRLANAIENIGALKYIGSFISPYNVSFNTFVTYKDFHLSVLFTSQWGGYFRMPAFSYPNMLLLNDGGEMLQKEIAQRWKSPGDELKTDVPAYSRSYSYNASYYSYSDIRTKSSDYIALKEISLIYNMNKSLFKNNFLKGVKLTAQVKNIYQWVANSEGIDPRRMSIGYSPRMGDEYPLTVCFGVKINF